MARKLLGMMALISLVLLAQAVPGAADTLPSGDGGVWSAYSTVDRQGSLGDANNMFQAGCPTIASGYFMEGWRIAQIKNQNAVTPIQIDGGFTVTITYDTSTDYMHEIDPQDTNMNTTFAVWKKLDESTFIPILASTDFQLQVTATYAQDYTMTSGSIYGFGTNWLDNDGALMDNGAHFTLTATLVPDTVFTESTPVFDELGFHYLTVVTGNSGHFTDLQINAVGAPTPIPGAVWLLGTGLLGLGFVGRRRRS